MNKKIAFALLSVIVLIGLGCYHFSQVQVLGFYKGEPLRVQYGQPANLAGYRITAWKPKVISEENAEGKRKMTVRVRVESVEVDQDGEEMALFNPDYLSLSLYGGTFKAVNVPELDGEFSSDIYFRPAGDKNREYPIIVFDKELEYLVGRGDAEDIEFWVSDRDADEKLSVYAVFSNKDAKE